ncbi:putative MFS family arabinose efflux permease [Kribbella amoyensis]|uniref:Putative MFS family arabinose efflux permease n=1 Tax=Kribbella amoyensis TaxID=996641 RepID=A0A561BYD6_9ACTN|nr:MFS transporter [Kribbella amoyensis]TWD83904.1 putative MFS family arabinose efflux permease [Kribbella amoyensis]
MSSTDHALEEGKAIPSLVPARMDRLPWTRFHWMIVVGLGVSWILDGLEIQLVSLVGNVLKEPQTLGLTTAQVGLLASIYLAGEVVGALVFGRLTDKWGRRNLFIITLLVYLIASGAAGLTWDFWSIALCRFVAGMGIGGEYAAINSAIDELIPSKYRGRVDIGVNGTYWGGALIGSAVGLVLLNDDLVPIEWGWRLCFLIGPVMGLMIIYLRRHIPESPRWLMTHGRVEEAERTVDGIEETVRRQGGELRKVGDDEAINVVDYPPVTYREIARVMLRDYRSRSFLGFSMMVTQAFLYNAIFFTYALVLKSYFGLNDSSIALYFFPFALGNLAGPLLLGHLFDTIGRRKMILATYSVSAVVLFVTALLFNAGALNALSLTGLWCVVFFFASAGASSAYLTVSEIFPIELRGQAISFFFAISQLTGGVVAPFLFASLIGEGDNPARGPLTVGYIIGAAVMLVGGLIAWFFGVDAEQQSLENVAKPLSARERASASRFQGTSPRLPSVDAQGRRITPVLPPDEQNPPPDPTPNQNPNPNPND